MCPLQVFQDLDKMLHSQTAGQFSVNEMQTLLFRQPSNFGVAIIHSKLKAMKPIA